MTKKKNSSRELKMNGKYYDEIIKENEEALKEAKKFLFL